MSNLKAYIYMSIVVILCLISESVVNLILG